MSASEGPLKHGPDLWQHIEVKNKNKKNELYSLLQKLCTNTIINQYSPKKKKNLKNQCRLFSCKPAPFSLAGGVDSGSLLIFSKLNISTTNFKIFVLSFRRLLLTRFGRRAARSTYRGFREGTNVSNHLYLPTLSYCSAICEPRPSVRKERLYPKS